ncbi:DUF202 domain-containing protein [Nocardia wallacei]|uniref:DUF202 domain-containing protein n=1 Tax=Nocardia wallacei TaxID=480035 RepID=UPI00245428C8|nr:DUF202 domain-containing protein [Nocardia wallacei]
MSAPTLAAERTALAWRRTAFGAMGTAALFLHAAIDNGWRGGATAPLAAAIMLLVVAGVSFLRNRSLQHGHWGHGGQVVAVTTVATITVALVAAAIAGTDPLI